MGVAQSCHARFLQPAPNPGGRDSRTYNLYNVIKKSILIWRKAPKDSPFGTEGFNTYVFRSKAARMLFSRRSFILRRSGPSGTEAQNSFSRWSRRLATRPSSFLPVISSATYSVCLLVIFLLSSQPAAAELTSDQYIRRLFQI